MGAQKKESQISQNNILHTKFSEFYLCFHNSCELWHSFSQAPWEIVFGVITDSWLSTSLGTLQAEATFLLCELVCEK